MDRERDRWRTKRVIEKKRQSEIEKSMRASDKERYSKKIVIKQFRLGKCFRPITVNNLKAFGNKKNQILYYILLFTENTENTEKLLIK